MDAYLLGLCQDYVDLVDAMEDPNIAPAERRKLDSQRQVTHNEIIRYAGISRTDDAYIYAKTVLYRARGGNVQ